MGTTHHDSMSLTGDLSVTGSQTFTGAMALTGGFTGGADSTMSTDKKIQFRDTGLFINSSADGQLDIDADTELEITAPTVDLNGALDVSGTVAVGDDMAMDADKEIQFRDSDLKIYSSADGQLDIDADTEVEITTDNLDINSDVDVTGLMTVDGTLELSQALYDDDFLYKADTDAPTNIPMVAWAGADTSSSGAVKTTGEANGSLNLSSGGDGAQDAEFMWSAIPLDIDGNPVVEFRFKLSSLSDVMIRLGVSAAAPPANDYLLLEFDDDTHASKFQLISNNNGGGQITEQLANEITADTWVTVRIELNPDPGFELFIDGVKVETDDESNPLTNTVRDTTLYAYAICEEAAAADKQLRIDRLKIFQDR